MNSFDREWERKFAGGGGGKPVPPTKRRWTAGRLTLTVAGALALFIIINLSKGFYTEWLWFSSLGYGDVYTNILQTKVLLFFSVAIVFFALFFGNFMLATRLAPKIEARHWPWAIIVLVAVLLSLISGLWAQANWQVVLRFFNGQPFGIADPVFHKEISFYVFSLPFLRLLRGWLLNALIITLLGVVAVYIFSYMAQRLKFDRARPVLAHVGALVIAILGLFIWSYWLGIWELVFSERGVIFGACYADMHAKLPSQWILIVVVLLAILALLAAVLRRNLRWVIYGIGGWIVVAIIAGWMFPNLMQRFQVQPNELALETPYIEYNIEFTREAFALNWVEEQAFPAEKTPSPEDVARNEMTINNIRLWDHRPLKDTYNQLQSIRLYYDFHDVDVDRYVIDGKYRQVMLSARELSAEKFSTQAQTWVNRQLQFTHGYGAVLSTVNEISAEGLPVLRLKDIPPVGDFNIERPQIYFGEKTDHHVIVQTKTQEFDYPMGDENIYGRWQGEGGVNIGGFMRRLVYAWQLGDFNILISSEITPESQLLYYRNIKDRINHLAPFLTLDSDPYLVVVEGRLFWIQDAYTTTDRYPYSERHASGINYIRNSVKVVVDAYDGSVDFYVTDPEDPLIQTYQSIFPKLFTPAEQMSESLRAHLRYPEDMFYVQASAYQAYHMRDARVFYNKEDLWAMPKEIYAGTEQPVEPYYIIMRLPDEEKEEFLLMLPFTPVNKNNTIGWLAARCDGENYGRMLAYYFPKERLVYGPSQIENRIQQDTTITEQLALWGRGGSRVIRGNLLLIPLGNSNLYIEPVFLQADAGGLPEMKRVIVAAGEQIAMKPTLEESITAIFGTVVSSESPVETPTSTEPQESPTEPATIPSPSPGGTEEPLAAEMVSLIEQAQQHYDNAQQYLKEGNWAGYGKELDALKTVLVRLAELADKEKN